MYYPVYFGFSGAGVRPTVVKSANSTLKKAFSDLPNCAKVFGGTSKVDAYAASVIFLDGRGPGNMNYAGGRLNGVRPHGAGPFRHNREVWNHGG